MSNAIHPQARVGHVHLTVADLDRSIAFYRDVLGFEPTVVRPHGKPFAFLGAGGYHHVALNARDTQGAAPAPAGHPGLYHVAFGYPDRPALAAAARQAVAEGVVVDRALDHGPNVSIYFSDPDGHGIELFYDRPRDQWPRDADGQLTMDNVPFALADLLQHAPAMEPSPVR